MNTHDSLDDIANILKQAPNIRIDAVYSGQSNSFNFIIHNNKGVSSFYGDQLTIDLLALIDGNNNSEYIIDFLRKKQYKVVDIKNQINTMLAGKIIIDASHKINNSYASFWLDFNLSPDYVLHKLQSNKVSCINYSSHTRALSLLKRSLTDVGLVVVPKNNKSNLIIVLVDDYLQKDIAKINKKFLKSKQKWLLISITGIMPLLGPIFNDHLNNKDNNFCYQCLYKRVRQNRQIANILGNYKEDGELIISNFRDDNAMASISYQFAFEIARYIILGISDLNDCIRTFDWHNNKIDNHKVSKIPQCSTCGIPLDNKPSAFVFDNVATTVLTSGGYKTKSPEKTLAQYKHLVSPISGVVSHLKLISSPEDDWAHVYESGNNLALASDNVALSLFSVRMLNAGKGKTRHQAKVSALAESIERYCSAYQGDEVQKKARFIDFKAGDAILPNKFMHYSDNQYNIADETNKGFSAFHHTPQKIDINKYYQWSPIWSILESKHIWVPTQLLYFGYPYGRDWVGSADTNGTASGNSKTEAFVQAFFELVERDNIAIWWHNRLQYKAVDLSSFADEHITSAVEIHQKRYNRKLWAIDITNDIDIPTFVVVSYIQTKDKDQDICFAAACHFDPEVAMLRAVCEHTQLLETINNNKYGKNYEQLSYEFANWLQNSTIEDEYFKYLTPSYEKIAILSDYKKFENLSLNAQRDKCIQLVKDNNWQIYVIDFTRADIGMSVVKVMIPQLRSMHTRLGAGRMYDVPVKTGKLKRSLLEKEINKVTIFI